MGKLDDLDMRILCQLQKECRNPLQEIAEIVKAPVSTVHYRVKRLEKEGIITGYSAKLNAEKLEMNFNTIVSVYADQGPNFNALGPELAKVPGVWAVYCAFGEIDYFVLARARNRNEYNDLAVKLMSIEGIRRTSTHVISSIVKEDPQLQI